VPPGFETESPEVQALVREKPRAWEFLLTARLLEEHLASILRELGDIQRGLVYRSLAMLNDEQSKVWIQLKVGDMITIVELINVAVNEEIPLSWGPSGIPGNPVEISRAVYRIVTAGNAMLNWETDLRFTQCSERFERIRTLMQNWTYSFINELTKIHTTISARLQDPNATGVIEIKLTFASPDNIEEINAELRKLRS